MADYNRVILMGRLTRDPELRYIPSGTAVTNLGLAVNDRRKNQSGEWVDETQFIDVTLWARQAEIASEYLTKGSPVFIEGRLKLDQWEKEGQKHSKLHVVGEKLQFIGSKDSRGGGRGGPDASAQGDEPQYSGSSSGSSSGSTSSARQAPAPPPDNDLPF